MPWKEVSKMSQKNEFVKLAIQDAVNIAQLCSNYEISRTTAYKWINRYKQEGLDGLEEKSKKPINSPYKTPENIINLILETRNKFPAWGGRKIRAYLEKQGHKNLPVPSTITKIFKQNNLIDKEKSDKRKHFIRFEHENPNDLWQMDFKGNFPLKYGRCHPLTVLDDHSRYCICLKACSNEKHEVVKTNLIEAFKKYGLPKRFTMDNGAPWGCSSKDKVLTKLAVWFIKLGIFVGYSRPRHPQTQGKDERFHRSLKEEVLNIYTIKNIIDAQNQFNQWRFIYNCERPHEALNMGVPVERYCPSNREYTDIFKPIEYLQDDIVRKADANGQISYKSNVVRVGDALVGEYVAIRPTQIDGEFNIFFCQQKIKHFSLR